MTLLYILLVGQLILGVVFYKRIIRMLKYQHFRSEIIFRILEKENGGIYQSISEAIDAEIDNRSSWVWKETILNIRAKRFFALDDNEAFQKAFSGPEILSRLRTRNKEMIKDLPKRLRPVYR